MRRRCVREAGVNLVEAALIVPLLLLILAGVIDLGRAYHTYITLINASREGARYAVNHPYDTAGIELAVRREAQNSQVDLSAATITISNQGSGGAVRVTVQVDFQPILGSLLGVSSIPIRASTAFRAR